jgi:DNA gyrase subunit A
VLKRDAIARVVLNNLYKHTDLQTNFSANMLALVDDVPRTLPIDAFISNWISHQIDVIRRRTRFRLRRAEERGAHLRGMVKALDALDAGDRADPAQPDDRGGPRRSQGACSRSTTCRRARSSTCSCAASPPRAAEDHRRAGRAGDPDRGVEAILASDERQRQIVSEELQTIVDKFGDARRSIIIPADGDLSMEDLIPTRT